MLHTETFSSILTSEEENSAMGGIAMLTLSDTENNLHFILILQGLIQHRDRGERKEKVHLKSFYKCRCINMKVKECKRVTLRQLCLFSDPILVPIRVQLLYRQHILREIRANITSHVSTQLDVATISHLTTLLFKTHFFFMFLLGNYLKMLFLNNTSIRK